ncbi:hypothetical protein [Agrococcus sp. KRD186]|uniref:hypothetical protein n=1 Tax=Agrococcus sp. KRD186 TaxID=2729730 RepID=UPI0019D1CDD5|nr:hypothetical protein [Agrococcus sp. KRD186]
MTGMRDQQSADRARPPLPADEQRRLRSIGMVSGALVGVGIAVLLPGLLFSAVVLAFSGGMYGASIAEDPYIWWVLAMVVGGALLVAAGLVSSRRRLRHWEPRRAARVTYAAGALAAVGALLIDVAMFGAFVLFESAGISPVERVLVPVAGMLGIAGGALVGRFVWPWMGRVLQQ